jgi:hypothetical protein
MVFFAIMSYGLMGTSGCGGCAAALYLPGIPEAARDLLIQFLTDDGGLEPQMHGHVLRQPNCSLGTAVPGYRLCRPCWTGFVAASPLCLPQERAFSTFDTKPC